MGADFPPALGQRPRRRLHEPRQPPGAGRRIARRPRRSPTTTGRSRYKQELRQRMGADFPLPWVNALAAAFMNRGNARQGDVGERGGRGDRRFSRAIALRQELRGPWAPTCPPVGQRPGRGLHEPRQRQTEHAGGHAAIHDYGRAIALKRRCATRSARVAAPWVNGLATAYMNRGSARPAPEHRRRRRSTIRPGDRAEAGVARALGAECPCPASTPWPRPA